MHFFTTSATHGVVIYLEIVHQAQSRIVTFLLFYYRKAEDHQQHKTSYSKAYVVKVS